MNTLKILALAAGLAICAAGCSSFGPGDKEISYATSNTVMHAAFAQPRATPVWEIVGNGTNTEFTVKNFVRMTVSSPISPIPLPAAQPGFWSGFFGMVERVAWPLAWLWKDTSGTYTPTPSIRGPTTINVPAPTPTP